MKPGLAQFTEEHRYLLDLAGRRAGFAAPMAVYLDDFWYTLTKLARKGELLPIDGVMVRHWEAYRIASDAGITLGMRMYRIEDIRFVHVCFPIHGRANYFAYNFVAVDRKDYRRLYKIAVRGYRDSEPPAQAPVLLPEQSRLLWQNTIGYLEPANLRRITAYGGRGKRGVLLTGPPGNGKSMACRWLWEECRQRGWEWELVTPDNYREARQSDSVKDLFSVDRCGIIFFDDMDLALRDRETTNETEDQAVFLTALDGLKVQEGVVFVFTTNCSLELIDRAFKRPGRLDVVLNFGPPDASLRRQLMERWHADILTHLDLEAAVASTHGYSFAEIEELKNLLILHFMDSERWDWSWALGQFAVNRQELTARQQRRVGFDMRDHATNGIKVL